jgi:hypothetical protein
VSVRFLCICSALLATFAAVASAEEPLRKDEHGNPAPNTEFRNATNGFGGWLVVTPDSDWQAKWETSPETVPRFNTAETVKRGGELFILIFFSNPKLSDNQTADVTCDIDVTRADGSSSIHQIDAVCFRGELKTPSRIYLSAPIIRFIGEPKDPAGKWVVRVTLKDNVRHVSLPLKTSFMLE